MSVKLFVWYGGVLGVDDGYDTAEEAIESAVSISDYGDGFPHGVQDGDQWITPDDERWKAVERAERKAQEARWMNAPPTTHVVEVQAPDGEWAAYQGFPSIDEAKVAATRLGHSRIRTTGSVRERRTVWVSGVL